MYYLTLDKFLYVSCKKKIQAHRINIHKSKRTYLCDAFFFFKAAYETGSDSNHCIHVL